MTLTNFFYRILLFLEFTVRFDDDGVLVVQVDRRLPASRIKLLDENRKEIKMAVVINSDKTRTFSIQVVDAKGRPARLDGIPVWAVSPTGGVALFPANDGMSCDVSHISALDGQVLTVTGDGDLGSGTRQIIATADIQTLAAEAASFNLSAGVERDSAA